MDQGPSNKPCTGGEIAGITLTVDASGQQPAQSLKFWKSSARVIEIGRRSAQAKGDECDGKQALFRCPVISRKHAKITFSEYGNVYVTDLKSHHGTHIKRPDDTISRLITPEIPNVLADGDVLTFGKAVGKEQEQVRPITVHVQLLFSRDMEVVPLAAAVSRETNSPRSSSGRYGVFLPPSDTSSSSESDSDIEEIPPPLSPNLQTHGFEFSSRLNNLFQEASCSLRRDSEMIRRHILPPITVLFSPSPEPPTFGLGSHGDTENSFDIYDVEGSPELGSEEAPIQLPAAPSIDTDAPSSEFPLFIGGWPKSPSRSSSGTPAEENAYSHVSSAGHLPPHLEEQSVESREVNPDDDLYMDAEPFTSHIWNHATAEVERVVLEQAEHFAGQQLLRAAMQSVDAARQTDSQVDVTVPAEQPSEQEQIEHEQAQTKLDLVQSLASVVEHTTIEETHSSQAVTTNTDVVMSDAASEEVANLRALREELEEMHAKAQKELEAELQALRTARSEAETIATRMREQMATAAHNDASTSTIPATPLKRKRDIGTEYDDDACTPSSIGVDVPRPIAPSTKRRKTSTAARVVSVVVQTTAVATLGAVAAWTALAFS
ncbi:hypothetical protein EUX98_g2515 [Antrodiella citrinella]|uniref:FHA domain-containing protein n=1 Tax=Antrodiella citrinella TaxID=2447956 RepID=A0A4S4MYU1_9APHY|nr:hypothetical protein EUX98_g2515 [Antrodiella citrinella]